MTHIETLSAKSVRRVVPVDASGKPRALLHGMASCQIPTLRVWVGRGCRYTLGRLVLTRDSHVTYTQPPTAAPPAGMLEDAKGVAEGPELAAAQKKISAAVDEATISAATKADLRAELKKLTKRVLAHNKKLKEATAAHARPLMAFRTREAEI